MNAIEVILMVILILDFVLMLFIGAWIIELQKEIFKVRRDITIIKNIFRSEINDM